MRTILSLTLLAAAAGAQINIGSFDATRSRLPFGTATGTLGYARLRASLASPANFGPGGVVPFTVSIAPGTPTITAAYLADKHVFFTSVFTGPLSASEAQDIQSFVLLGGTVIVEGDTTPAEMPSVNSLLAAVGATATIGTTTGCSSGTVLTPAVNVVTNGPFGSIAGASFNTSTTALGNRDGREIDLVTCPMGLHHAFFRAGALIGAPGMVMYGGDPGGLDLFTTVNPNNERMYLNAIAYALCPAASGLNYGAGWPGSMGVPAIAAGTPPAPGEAFGLDVGNSSAIGTSGVLIIGTAQVAFPTPLGGTILASPEAFLPLTLNPGVNRLVFLLPPSVLLCGQLVFVQALEIDSGASAGVSFTPGLRVQFGK